VSPIDASLAVWGEGRRGRIAELEGELRRHDDAKLEQTRRQQGSGDENDAVVGDGGQGGGGRGQSALALAPAPIPRAGETASTRAKLPPTTGSGSAAETAMEGGEAAAAPATETRGATAAGVAAAARRRTRPETGGDRGGAPSSLEERLGRWGAGWRPPALRELPRGGEGFFSGWTHLGQPERFELVKSVNR